MPLKIITGKKMKQGLCYKKKKNSCFVHQFCLCVYKRLWIWWIYSIEIKASDILDAPMFIKL